MKGVIIAILLVLALGSSCREKALRRQVEALVDSRNFWIERHDYWMGRVGELHNNLEICLSRVK